MFVTLSVGGVKYQIGSTPIRKQSQQDCARPFPCNIIDKSSRDSESSRNDFVSVEGFDRRDDADDGGGGGDITDDANHIPLGRTFLLCSDKNWKHWTPDAAGARNNNAYCSIKSSGSRIEESAYT